MSEERGARVLAFPEVRLRRGSGWRPRPGSQGPFSRCAGRAVRGGRRGPPSWPLSPAGCVAANPSSVCGWKHQGRRCQRQCAGASRFCFTRWLLATCFLHSAHSVSHFTLPQAKGSMHLVQTLLTGLGGGDPGWAQLGEFTGVPLVGTPVGPAPRVLGTRTASRPCKPLWELLSALRPPPAPL